MIYFERSGECILNTFTEPTKTEFITFDKDTNRIVNITIGIINGTDMANIIETDFIYFDEYNEECSDMEISYMLAFVIIGIFIFGIIIAIAITCICLSYRRKYYDKLSRKETSKEMKEIPNAENIPL